MQERLKDIYRVMDNFSLATGIEIAFFDNDLNLVAQRPDSPSVYQLPSKDAIDITAFIADLYEKKVESIEVHYTFTFQDNYACVLVPLSFEGDYIAGCFATEPVFLQKPTIDLIGKITDKKEIDINDLDRFKDFLRRMPVRSLESTKALGETLYRLCLTLLKEFVPVKHTLAGTTEASDDLFENTMPGMGADDFSASVPARQMPPPTLSRN